MISNGLLLLERCGAYLDALFRWISDEAREKNEETFKKEQWSLRVMEGVPQQSNGYDCGVFSLMAAAFISEDIDLTYSQRKMKKYREIIREDILRGTLLFKE